MCPKSTRSGISQRFSAFPGCILVLIENANRMAQNGHPVCVFKNFLTGGLTRPTVLSRCCVRMCVLAIKDHCTNTCRSRRYLFRFFFTDLLCRFNHGKVAVNWHIFWNGIARTQCITFGQAAVKGTAPFDNINQCGRICLTQ